MVLELNSDQRAQLELISMHAGKPPAQILTDAARYLFDNDIAFWENVQRGHGPSSYQNFLPPEELDKRFATLLRRA